MTNNGFVKTFLSYIQADHKVLDFGAGSGKFSKIFADKGAIVTAVDIKEPGHLNKSINFMQMKAEDFVYQAESNRHDLVFMRNILQFLDKQWVFEVLFPWLHNHLNKNGVIGIETFYQEPEPPFDRPLRSLYSTRELIGQLPSSQKLYVKEHDLHGPDLNGAIRHFFISDVIVKKI